MQGPSRISNYKRNRRLTACRLHKLGNLGDDLVDRHVLALARGTVLELNGAILEAALAQNDLIREAHKVVVGKLKAGTLVTVVDDNLNTLGAQALDDLRKTNDFDAQWANGDVEPLKAALKERVWQWGSMKEPAWLVESLCGGKFDPHHFTDYLKKKYT